MPVALTHADLVKLSSWFPQLSFEREDQVSALLNMASADIQAVPGSGKTTMLGAKLALLSSKWPYAHRGICVISHTNVARQEVEQRLKSIPGGEAILAYPHYIGTIQTFVNRHLAMPWLREKGIEVKEIDDEGFSERILSEAKKHKDIRGWLYQDEWSHSDAIRGIRFTGPELKLTTRSSTGLPANGKTIEALRNLKARLTKDGWLRHDDMYAFAERALKNVPTLAEAVAHRFPLVFVDEMQDTNDMQLDVLASAFGTGVVMQRLGDINQAILNRGAKPHIHSFPRSDFHELSSSLRFGQELADVANRLKLVGGAMIGCGKSAVTKPALILYSDKSVTEVIGRFADKVIDTFTQGELDKYPVKALCAVKRVGNAKQQMGRHIRDYFPGFSDEAKGNAGSRRTVCGLVRSAAAPASATESTKRVSYARAAVLKLIQLQGTAVYKESRTWNQLRLSLHNTPELLRSLSLLVFDMIDGRYAVDTSPAWHLSLSEVLAALGPLVDADTAHAAELRFEEVTSNALPGSTFPNVISVETAGKSFDLHLDSIAGAKGETHLATLVLESCHNKRYDLSELVPFLTGVSDAAMATDPHTRSQLHNLFVAVTRARSMAAIAIHADRVSDGAVASMSAAGWDILNWTASNR